MYVCLYVCNVCMYVMYVCMYACMYVCNVCMHACMHVMYVCMCRCMQDAETNAYAARESLPCTVQTVLDCGRAGVFPDASAFVLVGRGAAQRAR